MIQETTEEEHEVRPEKMTKTDNDISLSTEPPTRTENNQTEQDPVSHASFVPCIILSSLM